MPDGIFPILNRKLGKRRGKALHGHHTRGLTKKDPLRFYLNIYLFFFSKEIHAKGKRERERETW